MIYDKKYADALMARTRQRQKKALAELVWSGKSILCRKAEKRPLGASEGRRATTLAAPSRRERLGPVPACPGPLPIYPLPVEPATNRYEVASGFTTWTPIADPAPAPIISGGGGDFAGAGAGGSWEAPSPSPSPSPDYSSSSDSSSSYSSSSDSSSSFSSSSD